MGNDDVQRLLVNMEALELQTRDQLEGCAKRVELLETRRTAEETNAKAVPYVRETPLLSVPSYGQSSNDGKDYDNDLSEMRLQLSTFDKRLGKCEEQVTVTRK